MTKYTRKRFYEVEPTLWVSIAIIKVHVPDAGLWNNKQFYSLTIPYHTSTLASNYHCDNWFVRPDTSNAFVCAFFMTVPEM